MNDDEQDAEASIIYLFIIILGVSHSVNEWLWLKWNVDVPFPPLSLSI